MSHNSKVGVWTDHQTGAEVDLQHSKLEGGTTQNCAVLLAQWAAWRDYVCVADKVKPVTCACEHPGQMYLQLRGLCPDTNLDRYFVPRNTKQGGVHLIGLMTSIIEYDKHEVIWKMMEYSKNTSATTAAPYASYVLGKHEWWIENDNVECSSKGESYRMILKMTGCENDEFTCSDGQCIRRLFIQFTVQKIEVRNERLQMTLLLSKYNNSFY